MAAWMEMTWVMIIAQYSVTILALIVFMVVFEWITPYKNWESIRSGNLAVAMATGGKILGVTNIFRFSIENNDTLLQMLMWGSFGFVLLVAGYLIFEFLTPFLKVDEQIASDNRAVGLLSLILSFGLSYVIGAGITNS
ncbi:DUF350 domain-containing protein [Geomicrobium sediminis]|uniref:Membrane protein n=1 Tax=Geomicrobium sediminis TaxID=1347788 RepID=A0ABS2P8Y0_9BACL|nr:DUF350 domain-containing protein [Geomicrobium sediminis]EZH66780.1 membrane protein [Bacillaceae bacterium JMAK1]MBM7631772.1 putative membrane protein [Geomicrobium sediminis]